MDEIKVGDKVAWWIQEETLGGEPVGKPYLQWAIVKNRFIWTDGITLLEVDYHNSMGAGCYSYIKESSVVEVNQEMIQKGLFECNYSLSMPALRVGKKTAGKGLGKPTASK